MFVQQALLPSELHPQISRLFKSILITTVMSYATALSTVWGNVTGAEGRHLGKVDHGQGIEIVSHPEGIAASKGG